MKEEDEGFEVHVLNRVKTPEEIKIEKGLDKAYTLLKQLEAHKDEPRFIFEAQKDSHHILEKTSQEQVDVELEKEDQALSI